MLLLHATALVDVPENEYPIPAMDLNIDHISDQHVSSTTDSIIR